MQVHVAIYKWKDGTSASAIDSALAKVKAVKDRVPGIQEIYVGPNTSKYGEGFTHAIVVVGEDREALTAYRNDSLHEEAAREIDAMENLGVGVDLEDQ